jgi:hypothetical protein
MPAFGSIRSVRTHALPAGTRQKIHQQAASDDVFCPVTAVKMPQCKKYL